MKKRPFRIFNSHLKIPQGEPPQGSASRVLSATNEFVSGTAVFIRQFNYWFCANAEPALKFLINKDSSAAKMELVKRGFIWEWQDNLPNQARTIMPDELGRSKGCVPTILDNNTAKKPQGSIDVAARTRLPNSNRDSLQSVLASYRPESTGTTAACGETPQNSQQRRL